MASRPFSHLRRAAPILLAFAAACDSEQPLPAEATFSQAQASTTSASAGQAAGRGGPRLGARLLAARATLQLTDDQVRQIEAIQAAHREKNRPLVEAIRAAAREDGLPRMDRGTNWRELTPEERQERRAQWSATLRDFRAQHPELAETRRQIAANTRAAFEELRAVLTAEQWERAKSLFPRRRGGRGVGAATATPRPLAAFDAN